MIRVFSVFTGVGGFEIGIENALGKENVRHVGFCQYEPGVKGKKSGKQHASAVLKYHWPDVPNFGDITKLDYSNLPDFDLLVGGPPCQDLSIAGARAGFSGKRSVLFFEYVKILREKKPRFFICENVASMDDRNRNIMSEELGVYPELINAALVSAQNRERYYWTNIPGLGKNMFDEPVIEQPADLGILLKDIIVDGVTPDDKSYPLKVGGQNYPKGYLEKSKGQMIFNENQIEKINNISVDCNKSNCLTEAHSKMGSSKEYLAELKKIGTVLLNEHYIQWDKSGKGYKSQQDRAYFLGGKMCAIPNSNPSNKVNIVVNGAQVQLDGREKGGDRVVEVREDQKANTVCQSQHHNLLEITGEGLLFEKDGKMFVKEATEAGCVEVSPGQSVDFSFPNSKTRRGRVGDKVKNLMTSPSIGVFIGGKQVKIDPEKEVYQFKETRTEEGKAARAAAMRAGKDTTPRGGQNKLFVPTDGEKANTLMTSGTVDTLLALRDFIRPLYPVECERLMTWPDNWTAKGIDEKGKEYDIPKTARVKLCGNGVVSKVVEHICKGLADRKV